ncbi:MAG TPA: hypothetical protein VGE40_01260 [Bacilli bacterium]
MNKSLQEWMMIAVGLIVMVALIWVAAVNRIEDKQADLDTQINTTVTVPSSTGSCTGC